MLQSQACLAKGCELPAAAKQQILSLVCITEDLQMRQWRTQVVRLPDGPCLPLLNASQVAVGICLGTLHGHVLVGGAGLPTWGC
jgi:hypothetical protein